MHDKKSFVIDGFYSDRIYTLSGRIGKVVASHDKDFRVESRVRLH